MLNFREYSYSKHHEDYVAFQSLDEYHLFVKYCDEHEISVFNFYLNEAQNGFFGYSIEYMDFEKMVFIELFLGSKQILEVMNFHTMVTRQAQLWRDGEYLSYLSNLHRRYYGYFLNAFYEMMDELPKDIIWNCFEHLWTDSEYLNGHIEKSILLDFFLTNPDIAKQKKELVPNLDKDGFLTVYRGESSKSKSYKREAISWTTSLDKAIWFSNRFSDKGTVYRARVHIDNVLAYITTRSEEEIIFDSKKFAVDVESRTTLKQQWSSTRSSWKTIKK